MPHDSPTPNLVDRYGRTHVDLRVSVTDRCDLRCRYCMPAERVQFRPHDDILSFEEIERFVRAAVRLGVDRVRLTGGEPLVRRGIVRLVEMLAAIPGVRELAMTTNGVRLRQYARPLRAAGLDRLNVSLDTLDRRKFFQITRRDELDGVLDGIAAAREAGFGPIKLNALAIRGVIEEDVGPLARYALAHGHELRFIEFMPADADQQWRSDLVLPGREILEIVERAIGPLEPVPSEDSHAPATTYRLVEGGGRIGVIPSVSDPFCGRCDRLRLTSDGRLRNCLFSPESWDVRAVLRSGGSERQIAELLQTAVDRKRRAYGNDEACLTHCDRAMHQIGG